MSLNNIIRSKYQSTLSDRKTKLRQKTVEQSTRRRTYGYQQKAGIPANVKEFIGMANNTAESVVSLHIAGDLTENV